MSKDQRTAGDLTKTVVDTTIPHFVMAFLDGSKQRAIPLSNDPMQAQQMFKEAIRDGIFVDFGNGTLEWINISNKDWAFVTQVQGDGRE